MLGNVASNLGAAISADTAEKDLSEFKHHTRVFLHEVRTPVQSFIDSPRNIRESLLRKYSTDDHTIDWSVRNLIDLESLAARLSFLVACQRREHLFKDMEIHKYFLLKNIVMPVVQTYKPYIKKKYDLDIQLDDTLLRSRLVYGNINLLHIAVNIFIDNAAKYNKSKRPILVYGELTKAGKVSTVVENDGYEILEEEEERIFDDGYRGMKVRGLKIDGTGVGLELAKDIAHKLNGTVTLKSRFNPVSFSIELREAERK